MIHLSLSKYDCKILSTNLQFEGVASYLEEKKYTKCLILSDQTVFPLYGEPLINQLNLPHHYCLIPPGEQSKTLDQATYCWKEMHRHQFDRDTLVIGIGGGVVTDLAGFVASCYMRGVDTILIPTTLLGMIDAAIGGKTGVNLLSGKNMIGTFHHPKRIFIISECLQTLPPRELRSGLAEAIKYGIIQDPSLFEFLERNMQSILANHTENLQAVIQSCCAIKAKIVTEDPQEKGLRAILNYGHTFAHAIETATHYNTYLHGEAVSIGMHCAALTSQLLGLVDQTFVKRQNALCQQAGLPILLPHEISIDQLIELMHGDKKSRAGKINLIVAEKIGTVKKIANVDKLLIKDAMIAAREGQHE